ncbi:MAG: hypothetical protein ABJN65_11715 [Parasphingorhabdus sp.]
MFKKLIDKIIYGGYESANRASTERVVSRYSRGNTSVQLKRYLSTFKLEKLLADGDTAAKRLAERAKRSNIG